MRLVLANHSTYPRVGEGAHAQRLRRAYAQRESGKIDDAAFDDIARDYVREVIEEQQNAGLDIVTDGLVYAYDVVAHPASRLSNIKIGGIVRFFDTNTYVRQPEPIGTPTGTFGIAGDFERSKPLTNTQLKAVITGPYTLARHSIIGGNGDFLHTATAYADALGAELEALNAAGATFVQIDEPSLLKQPEDAELVRNLLARATAHKGDLTVSLTTYFGDATTIYGELLKMPVDVVGFDLIYGPTLVDTIAHDGVRPAPRARRDRRSQHEARRRSDHGRLSRPAPGGARRTRGARGSPAAVVRPGVPAPRSGQT